MTFLLFSPSFAVETMRASSGQEIQVLPKQVLVKYKTGRAFQGRAKVISRMGAVAKKSLDAINVDLLSLPNNETIETFIEKLKNDPDIEFASPNGVMRALFTPDDTNFASQYYLGSSFINIETAWDLERGESTVVIADIDTGVDVSHDDLNDSLWNNPAPSGNSGVNGTRIEIDWNGDGDCVDVDAQVGPEQCASSDPSDDNNPTFHGTRIAGIMAAETNNAGNAGGMAGIAHNCRIMAVKVLNADGFGSFASITEGIIYAVDNGVSVINLSLGASSADPTVITALNYAFDNNVVVVAASGNSNTPPCAVNFPANMERVIAVGATSPTNTLSNFSCTGESLDLVAPGEDILSTLPTDTTNNAVDGTSFSSPMVAAVAGLIRSIDPNFSITDVTKYINFTATDMGAAGFDNSFGFGRLNAAAAVTAADNRTFFVSNPATPGETFPYPNPFHPGTDDTVTISLPSNLGSQGIEITLMNTAGEVVKKLSGTNVWNGRNDDGNMVASGMYFYFAKTNAGEATGKLTVIK